MTSKTDFGRKFEKRFAKKVGGRPTIASGALFFDKEDVKNTEWLFQTKATKGNSYILKRTDLTKLISNAKKTERFWGFVVEFESCKSLGNSAYVLIPISYISKLPPKFKVYTFGPTIVPKGKQCILRRDDLDTNWLDDIFTTIAFKGLDHTLVVMSELDFVRAYGEVLCGSIRKN